MPDQLQHEGVWWHRKDDGSIHRAEGETWIRWSPGDPQVPPPQFYGKKATASRADTEKTGAFLLLIGGALITGGVFMPWLKAASGFGGLSRSGFDWESTDALIILVMGLTTLLIAAGAFGSFVLPGWLHRSAIVTGAVAGGLGLYHFLQLQARADEVSNEFLAATVGAGIYVILLGAAISIAGGVARRSAT